MRFPKSLLRFFAAFLGAAPALTAQTARWDPPGGTLPVGEVTSLQLVFEGCTPDDTPVPPKADGLKLEYNGQSNNISIINGSFSRTVTDTFAVLITKQQAVEIPSFSVATNKGPVQVAAAHFGPAGATIGNVALNDVATAKIEAVPDEVWLGQVFDLNYSIDVNEGYGPSWRNGAFDWDPSPLVIEDWSQPQPYETNTNGPRKGLSYHTRAVASLPGRVVLNAPSQIVDLAVGVTGFGFWQQRQIQQFAVTGKAAALTVRSLPPSPSEFSGAVGDFKIASKIVPLHVAVGEPITWTVNLSGNGNWPSIQGLPPREVSKDFQVVQPKPKRTQAAGKLFDAELDEDVVLVPTRSGSYDLPPLDFTYFDPNSGTYKVITAAGGTVVVDPAPVAATPATPPPSANTGTSSISIPSLPASAKPPEPPAAALGDPLPPSGAAPAPMRGRTIALACAAPFVLFGLFWSTLALKRARMTEPLKPKREARRRLGACLNALRTAPSTDKTPLLLAWQRDSAVLFDIPHVAPPASALADPQWNRLWLEADRFLYSPDHVLPTDWVARAHEALEKKTLTPFQLTRLFLWRNLLPFAALAALAVAGARLAAADPLQEYRSGNFEAAEQGWSEEIASNPLDWSARYNLSLALSQRDRWTEAAVQASSAFIQNPSNAAVRHQLILACEKADFIPEPLDVLVQSGPVESMARLASPGAWEQIGIAASACAAAALGLLISAGYSGRHRLWIALPGLVLLAASASVGTAAAIAHHAYGVTSDDRAVVVWRTGTLRSIPTEADETQKTTPLPAGSTAIVNKTFEGWVRLRFSNGETGWVLGSEVVYLWHAPPKPEPAESN